METIFDGMKRAELTSRIAALNENGKAQWGKMNAYQMVNHCILFDEWVLGEKAPEYRQSFLGLIFGKMALKVSLKEDKPMKRNMPAGAGFKVLEMNEDFQLKKMEWIRLLHKYGDFSNPGFIHDFFGRMTNGQIGMLAYKHTDHHLRQFGC